ncbi:MAG TPA: DUF4338 domain-containing protein [Anaerolineae bacterium]|nr:DUF4338 domain-containing protein [Anaerolineae bacterium]HQI87008.1 DUF4338 domain-containing protein [Anaerolineae bacterium]
MNDIENVQKPKLDADELHRLVLERLDALGFVNQGDILLLPSDDKAIVRQLHEPARHIELVRRQAWLRQHLPQFLPYFAHGSEIDPQRIHPVLIEVTSSTQHDLFRVARLLWALPFSQGYGRRLRFLIMDEANNKLIGVLALQSPPIGFPARDRLFSYPQPRRRKEELVNQTMDIQTLGAVPPYNRLLGGKLIGLAAASNEIREAYHRKYAGRVTEMEKSILPAHLVALTTTSAFGRSSIYNRLRYHDTPIAESIGYTEGYGSFHLMELYPLFREFLEERGISTRGGFGTGPRRKWQTIRRALDILGFENDFLRNGVKREVFLFRLVDNLESYMEGRTTEPKYRDLPFTDMADYWRERWLLPRAQRVDGWVTWDNAEIVKLLLVGEEVQYADDRNCE